MRRIYSGILLLFFATPGLAAGSHHAAPQKVPYTGVEPPGTIVVSTRDRALYLILGEADLEDDSQPTLSGDETISEQNFDPDGPGDAEAYALRYPVAVGRAGFTWKGRSTVSMKREWPDWTPPAEMRLRRPELPTHMKGGPENPLGARALYLSGTLYRIHGTNEPGLIGKAVSSGCIRMFNDHVEDLYARVGVGTPVVVR